jgi:DNA polymerase III delta subunit
LYTEAVIIFLYGPDSYRRGRNLRELLAEYKKKHALGGVLEVDLSEDAEGWVLARDFLSQLSMFSEAKAVVIRESGEPEGKAWRDFLKSNITTERSFVFVSDSKKPTKPFSFLLGDGVTAKEFPTLSGKMLQAFIAREAAARSVTFEPEAARLFYEYLESQAEPAWTGAHELEKLSLAGLPNPIAPDALRKLIVWRSPSDVSHSARQILGATDRRRAIAYLEVLLADRQSPSYIFNSLGFQARGADVRALADYDVSVKSGKLEYEEALLDFVLSR